MILAEVTSLCLICDAAEYRQDVIRHEAGDLAQGWSRTPSNKQVRFRNRSFRVLEASFLQI